MSKKNLREFSNEDRGGKDSIKRMQTIEGYEKKNFKAETIEESSLSKSQKYKRQQSARDGDDKPLMKKNPNFGGANIEKQQQQQQYQSSDDDIPVGFSRRKRLSSQHSSVHQKKFETQNMAQNIVTLTRDEEFVVTGGGGGGTKSVKSKNKGDQVRKKESEFQNIEELNRQIQKENDQERRQIETEQMLEAKREEIQKRLQEHEETIRQEKERVLEQMDQQQSKNSGKNHDSHNRHGKKHRGERQNQNNMMMMNYMYGGGGNVDPSRQSINPYQIPLMLYPPNFYNPQLNQLNSQNQAPTNFTPPQINYFQPQMVPNLPQYTNLDIPGQLDQSLKQMKDTLSKLKLDNQNLKNELNKKQVMNQDMENSLQSFDKEKYQQFAQTNLKLKQQLEDMKRKESELKSRLSTLQATKQYLNGRIGNLSMDIDAQDKQEEALNKQIVSFNGLIREKEQYIKNLMNELNSLKESKDHYSSELQVLSHKEEFLVNELIFKEDQLNEIMMSNEEMRRKMNTGQSQSKFIIAENERLKKELSSLKEEVAVNKASSDFLQNELMGLNEHLTEYEHKMVMSQNTIDQLQRQNNQDKQELSHLNSTMNNQNKAYEELKNQLSLINERNQRISMQNEMMILKQQQQQEQLMFQMTAAANMRSIQKEDLGLQTSNADRFDIQQRNQVEEKLFDQEMMLPPSRSEVIRQTNLQQPAQQMNNAPPAQQRRRETTKAQIDLTYQEEKEEKKQKSRESSPYEAIQRKNKQGSAMQNTLKWGDEEEQPLPVPMKRINMPERKNSPKNQNPAISQQLRNQGEAMAGLLNWDPEQSTTNNNVNENVTNNNKNLVTRYSQPINVERKKFTLNQENRPQQKQLIDDDYMYETRSPPRHERSKSAKRADQMNNLLRWEEEDVIKDKRVKQSEEQQNYKKGQEVMANNRSLSREKKRGRVFDEGGNMQNVLSWGAGEEQSSPFKDRQMQKQSEENLQWKARDIDRERLHSPVEEGKQIRNMHYGQTMAELLSFQEGGSSAGVAQQQQVQQQYKSPENKKQKASQNSGSNKYGSIQISLVQDQQQQQTKKVQQQQSNQYLNVSNQRNQMEGAIQTPNRYQTKELKKQISQQASSQKNSALKRANIDLTQPGEEVDIDGNSKKYGEVSQQLHQKNISRKENLDKLLLQMQIEKEKLVLEVNKIGDFPKTNQQRRRKEEISQELGILNTNITNVRTKLKQLKP